MLSFSMKKSLYIYSMLAIVLLITVILYLRPHTLTPNILVFSIENYYLKSSASEEVFLSSLKELAKENKMVVMQVEDQSGAIAWFSKIELWNDEIWQKSRMKKIGLGTDLLASRRLGVAINSDYFIDILNDTKSIAYSHLLIKKRLEEISATPYFLLINYDYLTPPLYDIDLTELYKRHLTSNAQHLLSSYSLEPLNFKSKSFVFSVLFDDYRYQRPTSFQSAAILPTLSKRDDSFWTKSYFEFSNDPALANDLSLINEIYSVKAKFITNSIIEFMRDLQKKHSLNKTLIIISNGSHSDNSKEKFYKKLFLKDLNKTNSYFVLGDQEIVSQFFRSRKHNQTLDINLLNFIKDY